MNMQPEKHKNPKPLSAKIPLSSKRFAKPIGLDTEQMLEIKIVCNHSEELPEKYFSNRIEAKDLATKIRTEINSLLKLNGKLIKSSEFPITSEKVLEPNKKDASRVDDILKLYGVQFKNDSIFKSKYSKFTNQKLKGDLLRVFVRQINGVVEILLIDPYHLLATERYQQYYKENKHNFRFCLSCLEKISIMD